MLDLVIKNGWIVDGSGAPGFSGEVAIRQGKIVAVDTRVSEQARQEIGRASCRERVCQYV